MKKPLRVLMVEDSEDDALLEIRALKNGGYDPEYERVETAGAMRTALREKTWDIIVCDYQMPKFNGLAAIALTKETGIDIPMIIVSGAIGEETAADCMRYGANDYIMKGNLSRLVPAVERELQEAESRRKRRQVEELLLQRNRRLDLAQSVAKAGVWDWDIVTGHIEWSDHLFNLFGLDPQKTTASFEAWGSVIHPEDAEIAGQRIDKALKERTQLNSDYRIILPGGTIHWVNAVGEGEYDDQGRPVRMIGICLDITDRKQAERDLQESEGRLREVLENSRELSYKINLQTNHYEYLSPVIVNISGYAKDEIEPLPFETIMMNFIHPDDHAEIGRVIAESMSGAVGTGYQMNYRFKHKNGQYHWCQDRFTVMRDAGGYPLAIIGNVSDISQSKLAEEKLRASEVHLKEAQRVAQLGSWDLNVVTGDLQWSDECYHIYGFRPQEFVPTYEKFWSIVHPEDLGFVQEQVDAALNNDKHYDVDFRFVRPNGEIRWLHCEGEVMRDAEGKPLRFFGTQIDITNRKRYENEIKELALMNQRILNAAGDGIYGMNSEGKITFINPAAAKMLEYDNQELIGKESHDAFHHTRPDGSPFKGEDCPISKSFKNGIPHYQDSDFFIRKDGTTIPVEYTSSPITDNGKAIGGVVSFRDITERKRSAEALRESEQRFMDVLYSSPDAILLIDGEHFVDCNEATARMLGYADRNEFLKTHPSELSPPTQPDGKNSFEKANEMMRIASERAFHQFEWEHRRANGEDFPVEVSLTSIVLHGKIVIHCMWRDLTERKQAEEELQRTLERLKKAINTTIQVMVSAVEVRDPYTSGHQLRSADLARTIATEMELPPNIIDGIRMAGSIHDIGKLSIPAEILSKPTKLTAIEFSLIKEHSRNGYEMLKDVESPWPLAEIVYQHHERMDGSGYPRNLKGEEIIMEARIMAVADVVESMASHRPYRPALGIDAALEEIEKNKGIFYDNAVVDACLRLFREKGFQLRET